MIITKTSLIVGGSSGLGLELATRLAKDHRIIITGRKDPRKEGMEFYRLDLSTPDMGKNLDALIKHVGQVDILVFAAGFFQGGTITEITDEQIADMMNVSLVAPMLLVKRVLQSQGKLNEFIAISSTSQWAPRLKEPTYTAAKAGLGAFTNSLSLDPRVKRTLLAAPGGMKTNFWAGTPTDTTDYLEPTWAADKIMELRKDAYKYRCAKIMRNPARVEIVETRAS